MIKKKIKPSVVVVILLFLLSGYALFLEPLIGIADNGDFYKIMISNNLKYEESRNKNDYYGYFNHKYDLLQYFNDLKGTYKSTHSGFIKVAMVLDDLFTNDKKFDIRIHAALCLIIFAAALYWLVEALDKITHNKKLKYFIAFIAILIFGDIGYTAYFNSLFGEAVAFPFYLLSIASLLKFSKEFKAIYLVVFFLSTFMFIGSKNLLIPNGILACLLLSVLLFFRINKNIKFIAIILGSTLLISSIIMYVVMNNNNNNLINKYHMMTRGVMLFDPNVQDIQQMGINEQYLLLAGTIYFDKTPVVDPRNEALFKGFYSQYNLTSVIFYYFNNPKVFVKMIQLGWGNSYTVRPEVLGNYERKAGAEYGERTNFFCFWSYIKENLLPKKSRLLFLCIYLVMSINRYFEYRRNNNVQQGVYIEIILLYVFLTGFLQIIVSFIGAGDLDIKMNALTLDILFYYNFAYILSVLFKERLD